ncbi:MAG: DUF3592 domain-containing protein [Ruminococcus sp.]|nr:DUF3592 domain-containing protein [Ruminococcus sp.]
MVNKSVVYDGFNIFKAFIIIILGFICLCLCAMGIGYITMSVSSMKCTEEVDAVVVENVKQEHSHTFEDEEKHDTYTPVFVYKYNEKEYRTKGHIYTYSPEYEVGDEVVIKINPDDPEKINDPKEKSHLLVGILMEAVVVGVVVYVLYNIRSNRKIDLNGKTE